MKGIDIFCVWDCCWLWIKLTEFIALIVFDPFVELFITLCIVVNTLFMALDHHDMDEGMEHVLKRGNYVSLGISKQVLFILFKNEKDDFNLASTLFILNNGEHKRSFVYLCLEVERQKHRCHVFSCIKFYFYLKTVFVQKFCSFFYLSFISLCKKFKTKALFCFKLNFHIKTSLPMPTASKALSFF